MPPENPSTVHVFRAGETLHVTLPEQGESLSDNDVVGLGVRTRPLEPSATWRIRPLNSSVGWDNYHPHPTFTIPSQNETYRLFPGDNTLCEYRPADALNCLRLTFTETTHVHVSPHASPNPKNHSEGGETPHTWLSSDHRTLTGGTLLADAATTASMGDEHGFTHRLVDAGWYTEHARNLFTPHPNVNLRDVADAYTQLGMPLILWIPPFVQCGTTLWETLAAKRWLVARDVPAYTPATFPVFGDGAWGSYLDFTNPELAGVWNAHLNHLVREYNVAGFKLDFGENLPYTNIRFYNPDPPAGERPPSKTSYPDYASRATVPQTGQPPWSVTVRSGFATTPGRAAFWAGDQDATMHRFNGLVSAFHALRTSQNVGYSRSGFDVGGYFGTPTEHEMVAWVGFAAVSNLRIYHGLGERHPAKLGGRVRATHERWIAGGVGEVTSLDSTFWGRGRYVYRDATVDAPRVYQRQTDTLIVPVSAGRAVTPAFLPAGVWENITTGVVCEVDNPTVVCPPSPRAGEPLHMYLRKDKG